MKYLFILLTIAVALQWGFILDKYLEIRGECDTFGGVLDSKYNCIIPRCAE